MKNKKPKGVKFGEVHDGKLIFEVVILGEEMFAGREYYVVAPLKGSGEDRRLKSNVFLK